MKPATLIFLLAQIASTAALQAQSVPLLLADTLFLQQSASEKEQPSLINWYTYDENRRLIRQQIFQQNEAQRTIDKTADLRTHYLPSGLVRSRIDRHFGIDANNQATIADEYLYHYDYQGNQLLETYFTINHYDRWPGLPRLLWTDHKTYRYDNRGCLTEIVERVRNAAEKEDWRFTERQTFLTGENCQITGKQNYAWHIDSSKWRLDQYETLIYNGQGLVLDRLRYNAGGELRLEEHSRYNLSGRLIEWTGWYWESGNRYRTNYRYDQDTLLVYKLEEASFPETPWFPLSETHLSYQPDGKLAESYSDFGWIVEAGRWEGNYRESYSYDTEGRLSRQETEHRTFDRSLFPAEVLRHHEHYEIQYTYRCDGAKTQQYQHYLEPTVLYTGHEYLPPDQRYVFRYTSSDPCLPQDPGQPGELSLYPIPANDYLTIRSANIAQPGAFYRIWDMQGRLVHSGPVGQFGFSAEINTSELARGAYLLELRTGEQSAVKPFLVAR